MKRKYENIKSFSRAFYNFLYSKKVLDLLPGCGWCDGGCRSLRKALIIWLGKENVESYQIVRLPDRIHSDHALIKIGNYFLDGNGVSTYDKLYKDWISEFFNKYNPIIRPYDFIEEPALGNEEPFYIENEKILQLVKHLDDRFFKENILKLLN